MDDGPILDGDPEELFELDAIVGHGLVVFTYFYMFNIWFYRTHHFTY